MHRDGVGSVFVVLPTPRIRSLLLECTSLGLVAGDFGECGQSLLVCFPVDLDSVEQRLSSRTSRQRRPHLQRLIRRRRRHSTRELGRGPELGLGDCGRYRGDP
jgi:hypothetical protein